MRRESSHARKARLQRVPVGDVVACLPKTCACNAFHSRRSLWPFSGNRSHRLDTSPSVGMACDNVPNNQLMHFESTMHPVSCGSRRPRHTHSLAHHQDVKAHLYVAQMRRRKRDGGMGVPDNDVGRRRSLCDRSSSFGSLSTDCFPVRGNA